MNEGERVAFLVDNLIYETATSKLNNDKKWSMYKERHDFSWIRAVEPYHSIAMGIRYDIDDPSIFFTNPTQLEGRLDITLSVCLVENEGDESDENVIGFCINRYRLLGHKEKRGGSKSLATISMNVAQFDVTRGKCVNLRYFLDYKPDDDIDGGRGKYYHWRGCNRIPNGHGFDKELSEHISLACGIQFKNDYQWFVRVRNPEAGGVPVLIPTTPERSKSIFRLRDIPDGAKRRSALRNWVSRHRRISSKGNVSMVKEHLRGDLSFRWNDLECSILPSPYDLRRYHKIHSGKKAS